MTNKSKSSSKKAKNGGNHARKSPSRVAVTGIMALSFATGIGAVIGIDRWRGGADGPGDGQIVTVYKSPTCGCCTEWEEHLRASGFEVESRPTRQMSRVKRERSVPEPMHSCHTAEVDGYVIEGHVPAESIADLLSEQPEMEGLAVSGMPIGSPGMEVPGRPDESYNVVAFNEDGSGSVFARY